jgi:L-asparaginase/Glu-tRNA(Gln) amidotransferase subunit D
MQIALIETGGTVLSKSSGEEIVLTKTPLLKEVAEFKFSHFSPLSIFSEDFKPTDWFKITQLIEEISHRFDGFLILHGTDTMAYTAAYLSFQLSALNKPIVITGSNLPGFDQNSDSVKNINDALIALKNLSDGVFVSFAGHNNLSSYVHLGSRVRKVFSLKNKIYNFCSVSSSPIAEIKENKYFEIKKPIAKPFSKTSNGFSPVAWIKLYPGLDLKKRVKEEAILLELYPSAVGPKELKDFFALNSDKNIFTTTPDGIGMSENYPSAQLIKENSINLSMTPEAAFVKIGWASVNDISLVEKDIAGEIISV